MDLFGVLNNLFTKRELVNSSTQFKESFMINRFLSLLPETFFLAVESNHLNKKLPGWAIGSLLFNSIPKKIRAPRIGYIKKPPQLVDKEVLLKLGEYFCCSYEKAVDIKRILELNSIDVYTMFGLKRKRKK